MDFLKAIFNDKAITYDELVNGINAHNGNEANKENQIKLANLGGGAYVGKGKYDALETDKNGIQAQLDEANNLIETLKKQAKNDEAAQQKFTDYEDKINELTEQLNKERIDNALQLAIRDAKGLDADYLAFKLRETGDLEIGEDGKIKGIDEKITTLKTQFPNQFESATNGREIDEQRLPKGEGSRTGITQEEFNKMGYQSRLKLKQDQPDVYAQMTGKTTN